MSSRPYDDVLKKAQQLPADEQQRLVRELSRNAPRQEDGEGTTLGERLEARGLLGIAYGPADLSTNPKHMEGFGSDAH
jgi:hypothetical protein